MSNKQEVEQRNTQDAKRQYPLELVANLAATLLKQQNYEAAARSALTLLDACQLELDARMSPKNPVEVAPRPSDMNWNEFVKFLTGCERYDRAEPKMNDFWKFRLRKRKAEIAAENRFGTPNSKGLWHKTFEATPETSPEELSSWIRHLNEPIKLLTGEVLPAVISGGMVEMYKKEYNVWQKDLVSKTASEKGKKGGRRRKNAADQ